MKFMALVFVSSLSLRSFSADIKFIPFRISTYERVTIDNIEKFCPMNGSFNIESLTLLNSTKCSKKTDAKINIRAYIFARPDTKILIDQNKTIWLSNFVCEVSKDENDKIVKEIEFLMKGKKRVCKE